MKFLTTHTPTILKLFFFIILFVCAVGIQKKYDSIVNPEINFFPTIVKYVTPSFIVSNFSFGFENVLADFYWITIIQDFAGWNHESTFYTEEYDNLFTLDPKFSYPYLFGILTLPSATKRNSQEVEKAEKLAVIGIKNLPYNWEIPFYLGTQFNLVKAKEKALYYVKIAASRPIIPDMVLHAYKSLSAKKISGDNASRELIQTIYDTTESKTTKKIIKQGMVISDITQTLTSVVNEYQKRFGVYPTSLDDLVSHGLIQITPALTNEFIVTISATGTVDIIPKTH